MSERGAQRSATRDVIVATHRETFARIHLDHASQQSLAVGRNEVRNVELTPLHLLQQLSQVVVVERQRPLVPTTKTTFINFQKHVVR